MIFSIKKEKKSFVKRFKTKTKDCEQKPTQQVSFLAFNICLIIVKVFVFSFCKLKIDFKFFNFMRKCNHAAEALKLNADNDAI